MRSPKLWMVRDGSIPGVKALWWRIEKMESFLSDFRDDFRSHSAPWESFAKCEKSSGACDRCEDGIEIKWFHGTKIHHFDFIAIRLQTISRAHSFVNHRAISYDSRVFPWSGDPCLAYR